MNGVVKVPAHKAIQLFLHYVTVTTSAKTLVHCRYFIFYLVHTLPLFTVLACKKRETEL